MEISWICNHWTCNNRLRREGEKASCCECNPHHDFDCGDDEEINKYKSDMEKNIKRGILEKFDEKFPPLELSGYSTATEVMLMQNEENKRRMVRKFFEESLDQYGKQVSDKYKRDLLEKIKLIKAEYPEYESNEYDDGRKSMKEEIIKLI